MVHLIPYVEEVATLEQGLASYAKRSFEPFSQEFVDGASIDQYFRDQSRNPESSARLTKRTPLQIERDRILYSYGVRKQSEKYHVLYSGRRRIVRNYTTHAMRMAQVARAIARGLRLNTDFAEAVALGSKVGALPFVHASKEAISDWVKRKVREVDEQAAKNDPGASAAKKQLTIDFGQASLPQWVENLRSTYVMQRIRKYLPWAAGQQTETAYSSGQQSYWHLCTNPYVVESRQRSHCPETAYGIWRHTRGLPQGKGTFHHRGEIQGPHRGYHEVSWEHRTYEAQVVQYADDITWVVENLNDANSAALLNQRPSVYEALTDVLEQENDVPVGLLRSLQHNDAGRLYTYFIDDFIRYSETVLDGLGDGADGRIALRSGAANDAQIGLSPEAEEELRKMTEFLQSRVFTEPRVRNRFDMLRTVSVACVELLYNGADQVLPKIIQERGLLERWGEERIKKAQDLTADPIHRIQLAVTIFADMGDQEIYDFVGIQSL